MIGYPFLLWIKLKKCQHWRSDVFRSAKIMYCPIPAHFNQCLKRSSHGSKVRLWLMRYCNRYYYSWHVYCRTCSLSEPVYFPVCWHASLFKKNDLNVSTKDIFKCMSKRTWSSCNVRGHCIKRGSELSFYPTRSCFSRFMRIFKSPCFRNPA